MASVHAEASSFTSHEAHLGLRQSQERRQPGQPPLRDALIPRMTSLLEAVRSPEGRLLMQNKHLQS